MPTPLHVEIDIDLDAHLAAYSHDDVPEQARLADLVLDYAARQVLAGMERDLRVDLSRRMREITTDEISAAIRPTVHAAIAGSVQRTNEYGEPLGPETSMRDEIMRVTREYLTRRDGTMGRTGGATVVEAFIKAEVANAVKTVLKDELDAAKAELRAAIEGRAAEVLAETIEKLRTGRA